MNLCGAVLLFDLAVCIIESIKIRGRVVPSLYVRVWTWTRLDRRTPDRSASPAGNRTSCFPASGRCAGSDNRCFACVSEKKSFQIFDACKKKYRKIKFVKIKDKNETAVLSLQFFLFFYLSIEVKKVAKMQEKQD